MAKKKYKIIPETVIDNLIAFLDEIQFDAAKSKDNESINKINFCSWAIEQLINSYDGYIKEKPKKKSRDDIVDEQFHDWQMPDMSDDEFKRLVKNFDSFLKGWEKDYYKSNPKSKKPTKQKPTFRPHIEDVSEYMSLDEIKEFLLDDETLTDEERFELYYEEHDRVEREKQRRKDERGSLSYDQMLKKLNILPSNKNNKN